MPLRSQREVFAGQATPVGCYEFGPFRLNARTRALRRGDEAVALTPKAFDVLQIQVERADRVVERLLFVRAVDSVAVRGVNGTEGATQPFWSPDSSALGFFAAGKLKIVSLRGGPPQTLASISTSKRRFL